MNELLTAVKAHLKKAIPGVRDCFIAVDEQVIPAGTRLPAIGIKDGNVTTRHLGCEVVEKTMQITVICWAPQGKGAAQVTGDTTQPGVLTMAAAAEEYLDGNLLAINGMIFAGVQEDNQSKMYVNQQNKSIQQKTIMFSYVRER